VQSARQLGASQNIYSEKINRLRVFYARRLRVPRQCSLLQHCLSLSITHKSAIVETDSVSIILIFIDIENPAVAFIFDL
jgi:hypothetical protein